MIFDVSAAAEARVHYSQQGFVGFSGLYSEAQMLELGSAVERATRVRINVTDGYFGRLDTDNSFNAQYRQFANLHEQDQELADFALDPTVASVAGMLEESDLVFLFSSSLHKLPFADPLRAHHDLRQMPFASPHMITAWIALDDVTTRNGCLYYLPGTNTMGVARAKDSARSSFKQSSAAYLDFYSEYDDIEPVFAEVPRGTVMLHSAMTIHGSTANISRKSRRAFSISYVDAGATCTNPDHPLLREVGLGDPFASSRYHPVVAAAEYLSVD